MSSFLTGPSTAKEAKLMVWFGANNDLKNPLILRNLSVLFYRVGSIPPTNSPSLSLGRAQCLIQWMIWGLGGPPLPRIWDSATQLSTSNSQCSETSRWQCSLGQRGTQYLLLVSSELQVHLILKIDHHNLFLTSHRNKLLTWETGKRNTYRWRPRENKMDREGPPKG